MSDAFQALMSHCRETALIASVSGRLGWDQQAVMPIGAAAQRASEVAAMERVLHARQTDPRIGEWLAAIAREGLSEEERRALTLIERDYAQKTKLPVELAVALAEASAAGINAWEEARANEDWSALQPVLERMFALKREEAQAYAPDGPLWDALLDSYEPGMTSVALNAIFTPLRAGLRGILAEIETAAPAPFTTRFDNAAQMNLCSDLARRFGYDFRHGRMDLASHPFCAGQGADVRITTRVDVTDPLGSIYSVIHEVGHGCYEQGINAAYAMGPLGGGVSLGVHESQSRIFENQLGRSRAFCGWLFGELHARFGEFGIADGEAFYRRVNHVHPGFIRTESDELHYNLHIMMRTDLERDLIEGRLSVADLPEAWDARVVEDFGTRPPKPSLGVLQDIHWSAGLVGYFPTYTIGNVYAGCLHQALRRDVPDLDASLGMGDPSPATAWLRDKVQRFGSRRDPIDTIAHATGERPTPAPLLSYLREKFLG